ncbi:MAG: diaminopimelate epimerase [Pseudomonadota bacterium]
MADDALKNLAGCPYWVMDGAGNDFVVVDMRAGGFMTSDAARYLGDREGPFGCDQIIGIVYGTSMLIWNQDGTEAGACGNAARCVAWLLMDEVKSNLATFGSPGGTLQAKRDGERVTVDMGTPRLEASQIPVAEPCDDTSLLPLSPGLLAKYGLNRPVGVSMGNPHAVFFVDDAEAMPLEALGPEIETHPLFPDRVNVTVASAQPRGFRARTWERGVGITKACGTAACATLVAAVRRGHAHRKAQIEADGGTLTIAWDEDTGRVTMTGPVQLHQHGVF